MPTANSPKFQKGSGLTTTKVRNHWVQRLNAKYVASGRDFSALKDDLLEMERTFIAYYREGSISEQTMVKTLTSRLNTDLCRLWNIDSFTLQGLYASVGACEEIKKHRKNTNNYDEKRREKKQSELVKWNNEIYSDLHHLFYLWLNKRVSLYSAVPEDFVRAVLAVTFFTGRRVWAEVGERGIFVIPEEPMSFEWSITDHTDPNYMHDTTIVPLKSIEFPEWADGWLRLLNPAKPTQKEKRAGIAMPVDFPIIGASPEEVVSAVEYIRSLHGVLRASWDSTYHIGTRLSAYTQSLIIEHIDPIVQPLYDLGYNLPGDNGSREGKFIAYHLRALYASRLYYTYLQFVKETSLARAWTLNVFISKYLGHSGSSGGAASAYMGFEFIGSEPTPIAILQPPSGAHPMTPTPSPLGRGLHPE